MTDGLVHLNLCVVNRQLFRDGDGASLRKGPVSDLHQGNAQRLADRLTLSLFARFDTLAFVLASASVAAMVMFLTTATLLVSGAEPGQHIGTHLGGLGTFWPGYSVSWTGSLVGALYAGGVGALAGFALSVSWNFAHIVIVGVAALRRGALEYD